MEMITTHNVCAVSDRGHDVKCLKEPLMFNSCCCLLQVSMNTLLHVVEHANKSYKANHLGWGDVISGAHELLTRRDLERFAALCNDAHDAVEGEYHLYKEWQLLFLGRPTYIQIRHRVEGCKDDEGSNEENWGGSDQSNDGCKYFLAYHQWIAYTKRLSFLPDEAARYPQFKVCMCASYIHCLMLNNG